MDRKAIREGMQMVRSRGLRTEAKAYSSYCFTCAASDVRKLRKTIESGVRQMEMAIKAGEIPKEMRKRRPASDKYIKNGKAVLKALEDFEDALADVELSV